MRDMRAMARTTLAFIWVYQGLVPKLLRPDTGEVEIFESSGLFGNQAPLAVNALGVFQILIGLLLVAFPRSPWPLRVSVAALVLLGAAMLIFRPDIFLRPFNPAGVLAAMLALSAIALRGTDMLETAGTCEPRNT